MNAEIMILIETLLKQKSGITEKVKNQIEDVLIFELLQHPIGVRSETKAERLRTELCNLKKGKYSQRFFQELPEYTKEAELGFAIHHLYKKDNINKGE